MSDLQPMDSSSFDPYHKLLGISRKDQPPTYYRLLGVERFEGDLDVIDAAADKQMAYLQGCRNGEHAVEAERLLDEVSEARLRLLNPESKRRYDQQLQTLSALRGGRHGDRQSESGDLANGGETPGESSGPAPSASSEDADSPAVSEAASPAVSAPTFVPARAREPRKPRKPRKRGRGSSLWHLATVVSCGLIILVAWQRGLIDFQKISALVEGDAVEVSSVPTNQATNRRTDQLPAAGELSSGTVRSDRESSDGGPRTRDRQKDSGNGSETSSRSESSGSAPPRRLTERSRPPTQAERDRLESFRSIGGPPPRRPLGASTAAQPTDAEPAEVIEQLPVPAASDVAEKDAEIDRTLAAQMRAAKSLYEKQYLATLFHQLSEESTTPAGRFALLKKSIEFFTAAGEPAGAMNTIDELETRFEVDPLAERLPVLRKLEPMVFRPLDQVMLADQAEALMNLAMKRGELNAAEELCAICKKVSHDLRNPAMAKKFSLREEEIRFWQKNANLVEMARERVETEPDNPKANELLGWFECFAKDNWEEGIPFLTKAANPSLREVAEMESEGVEDASEMADLADRWWELSADAEAETLLDQFSRTRALHWYQESLDNDLSGLRKVAAETRLEQARADVLAAGVVPNEDRSEPVRPRGAPEEAKFYNGNWYLFPSLPLRYEEAVAAAKEAGGRLVVVRSQAEHEFLLENGRRPLLLGMHLENGEWVDSLGERQRFFLWDEEHGEPDSKSDPRYLRTSAVEPDEVTPAPLAAISQASDLWADYHDFVPMYYVIEWGRE